MQWVPTSFGRAAPVAFGTFVDPGDSENVVGNCDYIFLGLCFVLVGRDGISSVKIAARFY